MKGFIIGKGKGTYNTGNPITKSDLMVIDDDKSLLSVTGDLVDNTDPRNPVINGVGVLTVTGAENVVDNTDPRNPIITIPDIPNLPENWVETVTGKWVNPQPFLPNPDPKNPIVFNNNYVRVLQIPYASLVSFDEAGILQYINYQMPGLPDGPFVIEEDEIFVIEITGIPSDGDGGDTPTPPTVWVITSPINNSTHDAGTTINITTNYEGESVPTKIEHVVNGTVRKTFTADFTGAHTTSFQLLSSGTYNIEARLYFEDGLYDVVLTRKVFATTVVNQALLLHSPTNNGEFMVGESFIISSEYTGNEVPNSEIRHYIQDIVTPESFPGTSNIINTSTHSILEPGVYEISAKVLVDGVPLNNIVSPIRYITIVAEESVVYTPITQHRAGNYSTGNTVIISAPEWTGDKFLRRETAAGVIREDEQSLPYAPPTAYLNDDINSITIPLGEVVEFKSRYQQVKTLLFSFSEDMPKVELIWLRGNDIQLGNLDLKNCRNIKVLDISRNSINSLALPLPNSPLNVFEFAYVGNYDSNGSGQVPRQVINTLMEYAYYSNFSGTKSSTTKTLNTGPNVGSINYLGMNFHKLLVDKGWSVGHISIEEEIFFNSAGAASRQSPLMCSEFNWTMNSGASWLTCSNPSGSASNNVQNMNLSVTANTTGAIRTTKITVHKWKTDGSGEYHYRGEITVRQAG